MKKSTGIILIDKEGRMLLQHRDKKAPTHPLHWAIFGGALEKDEKPEEGAKREMKEELGIKVELTFLKKYRHVHKGISIEEYVFTAPLKHPLKTLKKQQTEGDDVGLYSYEETKKLLMPKNDIKVLKEFNSLSSS